MNEQIFRYGENSRGIGIITLPTKLQGAPIVVSLNAGLLQRTEPYRLNVLVNRTLARIGYIALRVDLSGKGDTPSRSNLNNRESVALDWNFIKQELIKQFGDRPIIIFGLCSGADNGIKLSAIDKSIKGLILLDPISRKDKKFKKRDFYNKIKNPNKWLNIHKKIFNRIKGLNKSNKNLLSNPTALRDEPTHLDLDNCINNIVDGDGRMLLFFTGFSLEYYNQEGQFCRALAKKELRTICKEVFWPEADHILDIQQHRSEFINKVSLWAKFNLDHFKGQNIQ